MKVNIFGLIATLFREDVEGVITSIIPLNSNCVNPYPTFKVVSVTTTHNEINCKYYTVGLGLDFEGTNIVLTKRFVTEIKEGE